MLEDPSDQEKESCCGSQTPGGWPYLRKTLPKGPPAPSIDPTEWATLVQQFNNALGPPGAGFAFGGWKSCCSVITVVAFVVCVSFGSAAVVVSNKETTTTTTPYPNYPYHNDNDDVDDVETVFAGSFGGLFVVASESLPS